MEKNSDKDITITHLPPLEVKWLLANGKKYDRLTPSEVDVGKGLHSRPNICMNTKQIFT